MESPLMRLPRYARGLRLVRIGIFLMLFQLLLSIAVVTKAFTAHDASDARTAIEWVEYLLWTNLAASGAMLLGTLYAIPDFRIARMSLGRILIATLGFAFTTAVLLWSVRVVMSFLHAAADPDSGLADLLAASERLESLNLITIVKDLVYTVGLIALVRSIRQTAAANDHDALRDAAGRVSGLVALMLVADVFLQLVKVAGQASFLFALFALVYAIGVLVYWVYCHLRLAKFLRAAAILVNEPHALPTARVVSAPRPAEAAPVEAPRPKAVAPRPPAPDRGAADARPSAPVIVAAELRPAPAPRADTAPGDPPPEQPKFLL